jgi:hypothetical protein
MRAGVLAVSASFAVAVASGLAVALTACSGADLTPAPDAGQTSCGQDVRVFCDAGAPGPTACTADPNASGSEKRLPTASYPAGCHAVVLSADCNNVDVSCSCVTDDDAGVSAWQCSP